MLMHNVKEIGEIQHLSKAIQTVYHLSKVVWEYVKSCFGNGFWINDQPWNNDDAWNNG